MFTKGFFLRFPLVIIRFAFVKFANADAAKEAFQKSQGAVIDGQHATVLYAFKPKVQPKAEKASAAAKPAKAAAAAAVAAGQPAGKKQKTETGAAKAKPAPKESDEVRVLWLIVFLLIRWVLSDLNSCWMIGWIGLRIFSVLNFFLGWWGWWNCGHDEEDYVGTGR